MRGRYYNNVVIMFTLMHCLNFFSSLACGCGLDSQQPSPMLVKGLFSHALFCSGLILYSILFASERGIG